MKIKQLAVWFASTAAALTTISTPLTAGELTNENKQFLAAYDKVHHALASDELNQAKEAAAGLGPAGADLSKSKSLEEARRAFTSLSEQAKKMTAGQSGYYVLHCPMLKKDWVQTSTKVENPYAGKEMLACGEIAK
jgi:hypothetical protein